MSNNTQKTYLLLHGFGGSSQRYFLPNLANKLNAEGAEVVAPDLPQPASPNLMDWTEATLSALRANACDEAAQQVKPQSQPFNVHMVVAHSLGGALALQLFSAGLVQAEKALLIGSSFGPKNHTDMDTFISRPLAFTAIETNVTKLYAAFSMDDPWTLPEYGILLVKQLKAIGIIFSNLGHFETQDLPDELWSLIRK